MRDDPELITGDAEPGPGVGLNVGIASRRRSAPRRGSIPRRWAIGQAPIGLVLGFAVVGLSAFVLVLTGRLLTTAGTAIGAARASGPAGSAVASSALRITLPPSPRLTQPDNEYTNLAVISVSGTLPNGVPTSDTIRLYRHVSGVVVAELPVGPLPEFTFANVRLAWGRNEFTATIAGPIGETAPSPPIRVVYTTTKPRIVLLAPAQDAVIATATLTVVGRVPGDAAVVVRDPTANTSTAVTADAHGAFSAVVALAAGKNSLLIAVTDRAGNASTTTLTVNRTAKIKPG